MFLNTGYLGEPKALSCPAFLQTVVSMKCQPARWNSLSSLGWRLVLSKQLSNFQRTTTRPLLGHRPAALSIAHLT